MPNFTASDVKKLRDMTGAGMMDAKKALDEADGDFDAATDILRTKGAAKAAKRGAERTASAGLVAHSAGVLLELKCETDFVAKGEDFIAAAQQIADAASEAKPADVEALKGVQAGDETVDEIVQGLAISIGEKIEIGEYVHFDGPVVAYLHKRAADLPPAIGVLVEYDGDADAARGAAKQVAAMRPQYLTRDEVPADDRRARAPDRRGDLARGGQARAGDRQDHRGPAQRLLQGGRPPRAAVGDREQEVGQGRARRGRHHRQALRPFRGRRLSK